MSTLEQIIEEAKKLSVEEQRRLRAILATLELNGEPSYRTHERELAWIDAHRDEYLGQWVALNGDHLLAHGTNPPKVFLAARDAGIDVPYVERVEKREDACTGGWL